MSRVDVPTLMCDRCGRRTQDGHEMLRFFKLDHHHMSGQDSWDLCMECKLDYLNSFMKDETAWPSHVARVSQVV